MYETFSAVRSPSTRSKPDLIIRICGQPPQFSPEQQLLNWVTGIMIVTPIFLAAENAILGIPLVWPTLALALFYAALYYWGRFRHAPVTFMANIVFASLMLFLPFAWFANNGIDGSSFFFYLSALMAMMSIARGRWRLLWVCVLFGDALAVIGLQWLHPEWVTPYVSEAAQHFDIAFAFFATAVFMMGYVGVNIYNLDERRKTAEALLLNILPGVVARRLEYSPTQVIAEHYPNASILFADIVSFTPLSSSLEPIDLVGLLNTIFSYFDTLADKYQVEKIKTIGDCYMVAAGVPTGLAHHAEVLTHMALEMREYTSSHLISGRRLSLRIGINSGPVVAGVIGHRKFAYDLWGDAVNTASRMESHGQPNVIQITETTYRLIKDDFLCEPQGCIEVKGKGPMEVWHVKAAKR